MLNRDVDDHDARPSFAAVVAIIIHFQVDMLKSSSVVRPALAHATRTTTLSNRWIASVTGTDSSIPPPFVDGYTLPSGDTIPSVGLGTWRMSGEDTGKAVKVIPEELFDQGNPNGQFQAALSAGYRHIDCAWEYGVHHAHLDHNPEGHLIVVHRTRRLLGTRSTRAACDGRIFG